VIVRRTAAPLALVAALVVMGTLPSAASAVYVDV
jgi:hypothetical protein